MIQMQNTEIAERLDEAARLLAGQDDNPFRLRAYHQAAELLRNLDQPVADIVQSEGAVGLARLPGIGNRLSHAICDLVHTGHLKLVDRLREESDPVALLSDLPGIGPRTAAHLQRALHVETLEDLERSVEDGRLAAMPGIGAKRLRGIRDYLAQHLRQGRPQRTQSAAHAAPDADAPPVSELLAIDHQYRTEAAAGRLPRIAPRRMNPTHEAWLPILHKSRGDLHYTALFSNTAQAHRAGKTDDWVVIYYGRGRGRGHGHGHDEASCTVITASRGPLCGQRIVRGREAECAAHYAGHDPARAAS